MTKIKDERINFKQTIDNYERKLHDLKQTIDGYDRKFHEIQKYGSSNEDLESKYQILIEENGHYNLELNMLQSNNNLLCAEVEMLRGQLSQKMTIIQQEKKSAIMRPMHDTITVYSSQYQQQQQQQQSPLSQSDFQVVIEKLKLLIMFMNF